MELTVEIARPDGVTHALTVRDAEATSVRAVLDAIVAQVAEELPPIGKPLLFSERLDEPLAADRTLVEAAVRDGDRLRLIDLAPPPPRPAPLPRAATTVPPAAA